jgi:mannose-6-phosphate isomerase-like protein (cupin superfamily)
MSDLPALAAEARRTKNGYREFLRESTMSAGVYVLAAGAEDRQLPHEEDEVYYVVSGEGMLRRGEENLPVRTGMVHFVEARLPHRFHSITKELVLLVVFAPPEGTGLDRAI